MQGPQKKQSEISFTLLLLGAGLILFLLPEIRDGLHALSYLWDDALQTCHEQLNGYLVAN